ncbi:DASH complex subunit dad2 [Sporothrix epigloea]|uniref:DASH complex subunit DAD2 n=1 Tax=Sporothrix epigloea TaxID=1892477 RepID=A0ABP0DRR2_9PEZI
MAFSSRSMPSGHLQQTSVSGASAGVSLQARVHEKREELKNLKQLRDLSAAVASQMEALEKKLSTLSDGTEAKLPRAPTGAEDSSVALPQMLVRIPNEHGPALQAQADEAAAAALSRAGGAT